MDPTGTVLQYMGQAANLDLAAQDYSDYALWKLLGPSNVLPSGLNVTGSDSIGIGGLVVRNEVRSDVDALIDNAAVTTTDGDVILSAAEDATIVALAETAASSSGGST